MENKKSIESIAIRYGVITFLGLVAYFMIMKWAGLFEIHELRGLNFFILLAGIGYALKFYKDNCNDEFSYFQGLSLGMLTTLTAVIPFGIFIFFYLVFDVSFMQGLINNEPFGRYFNPFILSFLVAFEGIFSGGLMSFALMQYMRKSHMIAA
jgi:uncharacterized protein DUF4199